MKKILFLISFTLLSFTLSNAQLARVQVVHNSADAFTSVVDVYVNGSLAVPDAAFRSASPFTDLPAGIPLTIAIAPGDSTSAADAFYSEMITLTSGETYIVIAMGIESATGYNPSPPFALEIFEMAREVANNPTMIDVLVNHGATDAPVFDIYETQQELGEVIDNIAYTDYAGYLEFPTADYTIELRDETGTTPLAAYIAPLESLGLEGAAVTVVASGFWDPSQNSNGPVFGLYAVPPVGGNLVPLPPSPLGINEFETKAISVYPNPVSDLLNLEGINFNGATMTISDLFGRIISEVRLSQNSHQENVRALAAGVYVLTIQLDTSETVSTKFIKH